MQVRLLGLRPSVVAGMTVWGMVLFGICFAWSRSYDSIVTCLFDHAASSQWCVYQGAVYRNSGITISPRPASRFERWNEMSDSTLGYYGVLYVHLHTILLTLIIAPFGTWLCVAAHQRRLRRRRIREGRCVRCDYDLRGGASPRCPECGQETSRRRTAAEEVDRGV